MGQKLTIEQVAEHLQCSKWTVRRLISSGQLPAVHVNSLIRVDIDDVDAALPSVVAE